jgi:TP901 family phage tail tape measure protein
MSGAAVIGALRVVFDADNQDFDQALDDSREKVGVLEGAVKDLTDKLREAGLKIAAVGAGISAALTVPLGALARASVQTSGQFQAAMKQVESALDNVSADQLKALEAQARTLGPAVGRGASEAAGAIESLARNGLGASDILGGAFAAALKLAAAGQADLAPAADLTTDIMQQFGKTANDLTPIVDKVTGALNASKFGFQDYQLAVGQAGGVAGANGVSFEDFNTAIAGTSALFSSGSDAGTSFKTFLTSLNGTSKQAKKEMTDLGISFYDNQHRLKDLAEVAEVLRTKLGGLSEQSRTQVLTDMFGSDGMRTAIGLMKLGKDGFIDLQKTISTASADKQVAKNQEGYAAATARLSAAFENLKIAIGQSGLLDLFTRFTESLTRLVNGMANLSPFFMQIAGGFALLASAAGPLLGVIGVGLYLAVGFFLRTLGPLGWALSAVIEPIGTLAAALRILLTRFAFRAILTGMADAFLGIVGPIGWAVGAFLLFKDYAIPALEQFWQACVTKLGPPLQAIFSKLQQTFAAIESGPIGTALTWLAGAVGVIGDVIGTGLFAAIQEAGNLVIMAFGAIIAGAGTVVNVISDLVALISALLAGDFAGAWRSAGQIIEDVFDGIVNAAVALVPDMEMQLRLVYAAAKAWLGDGFAAIGTWLSKAVQNMVAYVAGAFPGIVAAAKGVYEGVKGWLVDAFGGILPWIGTAVKWIADRFADMKKALGFGGITIAAAPSTPAPASVPKPKPVATNSYVPSDGDDKKKRAKKGRDTKYDAENREELELQAQLEAARLRNDQETVRAIEQRLALQKQIEAYQRTGLSLSAATVAANRDMKLLADARAQQTARQIADDQRSFQIKLAEVAGNGQLVESLKSQEYLRQRIDFWTAHSKTIEDARLLAAAEQLQLDTAIAEQRERASQQAEAQRQIDLAKARGDTDAEIRAMEQKLDIEKRTAEYRSASNAGGPMSEADARTKATTEVLQAEQARQQGVWRDTIRGGFRAALDGNIGDWFQNWWKDRVTKAMESALNTLSDAFMRLFASIGSGGSGSGGLFGSIASAITGAFGGKSVAATRAASFSLPGFATGGSFEVGGASGIDQNVVSLRATKGEMINISRPGADTGGGRMTNHFYNDFRGADAAAVPALEAKIDKLDRSLEGRSVAAVGDAIQRRVLPGGR